MDIVNAVLVIAVVLAGALIAWSFLSRTRATESSEFEGMLADPTALAESICPAAVARGDVVRIEPLDDGIAEEWSREIPGDEQVTGVDVIRRADDDRWAWSVSLSAAEFARGGALEDDLESAITAALTAVPGVREAARDDREVWIVDGDPTGPDLVHAAASVIDALDTRLREELDAYGAD